MLAGQLLRFDADHELVFTHGAERDRVEIEQGGRDFNRRDRFDGGFRRGRSGFGIG